jgi:endonuclease/exonuclease/phosphatase family metal-dependent hydrolase
MPLPTLFALLPVFFLNGPKPVAIDGQFDDWSGVAAALIDPLDAPDAPLDIGEIRITHDDSFVHIFTDLTREVCIQQLDGMLHMVLDVDGEAETGVEVHGLPGADIVITLSPMSRSHGESRHMGVGLVSLTYQPPDPEEMQPPGAPPLSPYDVGFTFGPTHASAQFEFRMQRKAAMPQTPELFTGDVLRLRLIHTDTEGNVLDTTDVMTHALTVAPATNPGDVAHADAVSGDPLAKAGPSIRRVVSFNAQNSKMLQDAERAGRVMRALNPDVILLQELTERTRADEVESLLNRHAPPAKGRWRVHIGEGGGNLRSAVATHLPFELVESLRVVSYPDRPDRYIREAAVLIDVEGRPLLAMSVHLRCCGGATGPEEETRRIEVAQLRGAIDPLRVKLGLDGVIIGGDFNLVGTREPLDMLVLFGDLDNSNLAVAQPYQLDGRTNVTWTDRTQPFVPGRLDYVVTSDSSLETTQEFVFDSAHLPPRWLEHHNLQAADSAVLSDHRPLVIDLAWRVEPAGAASPAE